MKKTLLMAVMCAALGLVGTGCKTGADGKRVVDPIKLSQARDAIEPVAAGAIRRVLVNSPEHAPIIAKYVSSVGNVFCTMCLSNEFRPEFLLTELNKLADPELAKIGDGFALDLKEGVFALYKILWRDQGRAEIPPDAWLHQVLQFFCESINQGLTDAGFPAGVRKVVQGSRFKVQGLAIRTVPFPSPLPSPQGEGITITPDQLYVAAAHE